MSRKSFAILFAFILLYIGLRLILLHGTQIYHGLPMRATPDPEEMVTATMGWEFLTGPMLKPFWMYTNPPRDGGAPIVGLISVPFLALFGPTYFTLKLVGMAIFAVALGFMLRFLEQQFGLRTAVFAGLLCIFCAPFNFFSEFFMSGNYAQSFLIHSAILFFLFKVAFASPGTRRRLTTIVLGALCGFALYWHPYLLSTVFFCILVLLLYRRDFFLTTDSLFFVIAFVLAFIPAFPAYFLLERQGISRSWVPVFLSPHYFHSIAVKLRLALLHDLALMNYYDVSFLRGGMVLNYAYYLFFLTAYCSLWCSTLCRSQKSGSVPAAHAEKIQALLLLPPIVLLLYLFAPQANYLTETRYRYHLFIYLTMPIMIALFTNQCVRTLRGVWAVLPAAAFAFFAGTGLISQILLSLPSGQNLKSVTLKAYEEIGGGVLYRYGDRVNEGLRLINSRKDLLERQDARRGFLQRLLSQQIVEQHLTPKEIEEFGAALDEEFRPDYYRHLGRTLAYAREFNYPELVKFLEAISPQYRGFCYEGVGMAMADPLARKTGWRELSLSVLAFTRDVSRLPPSDRAACYRGLGAVAIWDYLPVGAYAMRGNKNPHRFTAMLYLIPTAYRDEARAGAEIGYYQFPNY